MSSHVGALGNELRHWLLSYSQVLTGFMTKWTDFLGISESRVEVSEQDIGLLVFSPHY